MQFRPLLAALLLAAAFFPLTIQSQTSTPNPTTSIYCVPLPRRYTSATVLPRMRRPRPDEVSLSPPPLTGPSTPTTNGTKHNNSSSYPLHALPPPPAWVLTMEDIITAIFRTVITILTLFNVNITWRIRGECQRRAGHRTHVPSPLTCPNSQPRSSTSQIRACMGWYEAGDSLSRLFTVLWVWVGLVRLRREG